MQRGSLLRLLRHSSRLAALGVPPAAPQAGTAMCCSMSASLLGARSTGGCEGSSGPSTSGRPWSAHSSFAFSAWRGMAAQQQPAADAPGVRLNHLRDAPGAVAEVGRVFKPALCLLPA